MRIEHTKDGWVVARRYWIFTQYLHMNEFGFFWWGSYFWPLKSAYTDYFIESRNRAIDYLVGLYKKELEDRTWL